MQQSKTTTSPIRYLRLWQQHIYALAEEIGPRGSTRTAERLASEYCRRVLKRLGLSVKMETFRGARSIYEPHLIAAILLLLAFLIYPLYGTPSAVVAAILSLFALSSSLLELSFRENPLRWMVSKGNSQNVIATLPSKNNHKQDIVLIGHVDSHRTPLIFRSGGWLKA